MVQVSVVIPTYRDDNSLYKCLESLEKQSYPKELIEVIVVDNDAESSLSLSQYRVKLLKEDKPGSYAARNKGLSECVGEIIAFTDSDCIAHPDWIKTAVELFERDDVDRIAGRIVVFSENDCPSIFERYEQTLAFNQMRSARSGAAVTANLIVRKQLFESVGTFNSELFSGGDVEWNKRASAADATMVYGETCVVYHPARADLSTLKRKAKRVAGGMASKRGVMFLIKMSLPPFNLYLDICANDSLTIFEKLKIAFLATCLKSYMFFYTVKIKLGLEGAPRS